jgi:hypothetical protein
VEAGNAGFRSHLIDGAGARTLSSRLIESRFWPGDQGELHSQRLEKVSTAIQKEQIADMYLQPFLRFCIAKSGSWVCLVATPAIVMLSPIDDGIATVVCRVHQCLQLVEILRLKIVELDVIAGALLV